MRVLIFAIVVTISFASYGQNGKLVEQTIYNLPDSSVRRLRGEVPELDAILREVNFYRITYLSDGLRVRGYLAEPKKKQKYPCIIYNRGGSGEFGKIHDEGFVRRGLGELARAGYVVVASQYRGNDGGEGKEEWGGSDVNDVLNLLPLLERYANADTSRIGMFGWSRGGMMTYRSLTRTNRIDAAVVGSGVADLVKALESRPEMQTPFRTFIPGFDGQNFEPLKERSVINFVDKLHRDTPILILQGSSDWRVPTGQVLELVNKLFEAKHPMRFILYEGGEHSLLEHRTAYINDVIRWFDMYVRDKKKWPSMELHGD